MFIYVSSCTIRLLFCPGSYLSKSTIVKIWNSKAIKWHHTNLYTVITVWKHIIVLMLHMMKVRSGGWASILGTIAVTSPFQLCGGAVLVYWRVTVLLCPYLGRGPDFTLQHFFGALLSRSFWKIAFVIFMGNDVIYLLISGGVALVAGQERRLPSQRNSSLMSISCL